MADLQYKASNIARAERSYGYSFFEVISSFGQAVPSMLNTVFMLEAGGISEEEAYDVVDGDGIDGAYKLVLEGLVESGFLGRGKDAQEAKQAAREAIKSLETLGNTGETAKA